MATNNSVRTRSERVASLQLQRSSWRLWTQQLLSGPAILKFLLACTAAVGMLVILRGWEPPFPYREGYVPPRAIVARVSFEVPDPNKTEVVREQRRREVLCYYENRPEALTQLRDAIKDQLFRLLGTKPLEDLEADQREALQAYIPSTGGELDFSPQDALLAIRALLAEQAQLDKFDSAMRTILEPFEKTGLLKSLEHSIELGNQRSILVYPTARSEDTSEVEVARVRHAEVVAQLPERVSEKFRITFAQPESLVVAKMVNHYLIPKLPVTLSYNHEYSEQSRQRAVESVQPVMTAYASTTSSLARAGIPLSPATDLPLLRREHAVWVSQLPWTDSAVRVLSFLGMVGALYLLCGVYIYYQFDRSLIGDFGKLFRLLSLILVTALLCRFTAGDPWRAEIIPMAICAITATVAYGRQVAILINNCLALAITLVLGLDIGEFVVLASGTCAAILFLGRIRTRTKLVQVGLATAAVVALSHLGVETMLGQLYGTESLQGIARAASANSLDNPTLRDLLASLTWESGRLGLFTLCACALMPALLPFIERIFGVQTDLSLIELGDPSHPLMRQLAQRAPGTYNHSINVAAIAEAAAESIGAHGLLTRVGAYFHDIGKIFKPNYFVENQGAGGNRHDSLQPAMSTLVIIAHVKDGADLARQHKLPQPLIDFIEQHHGTTLVEYFYREAAKRSQQDPNGEEVSETTFRYPGPKPQTLEAAVLMLADTVESACRTLVEPTASRIQGLVDQIALKKLLDGQFDECGLTLKQLDQSKSSLVKSLTAIYHGRIKYPGQQSA